VLIRRAATSAALALVLAVLTGCTSFDSSMHTRGSGELAGGFEIEPGTALLGAIFPRPYGGWRAVLRVDDDARDVFDRYAAQADALGIPVPDSDGEYVCDTDRGASLPYRCSSYGSSDDGGGVNLLLHAGDDDGSGYLLISSGDDYFDGAPPLPDGPAAPATGEALTAALTPEGETPVRLVEGSALLGEPIPFLCGTGGYLAVLHVSGDPDAVFRGYTAQFEQDFDGEVSGDGEVLTASYTSAGAGTLDATAVLGEQTYLLIARCND
jgi:hypothetical protein